MTTSNLNALNANASALDGNPELIGTGLPDIGELTHLANELFRSLPCDGSRLGVFQQAAPEIPASQQSYTDPAIVQLAVPSSADVPKFAHVDISSPGSGTNYYFLEALESHAKSAKTRDLGSIRSPAALPGSEQSLSAGVSAQEFGLPNAIDWQSLSKPRFDNPAIPGGVTAVPGSAGSTGSVGGAPDFYFLQHAHAPETAPQLKELSTTGHRAFDINAVRRDFPILQERVNGQQLVWFDNAATTQKPNAVIDRISTFYQHENSNIHRAAHTLAARSTDAYEKARETVVRFIHAPSPENIIFVRGTTEAINLVAQSWGRQNIKQDDEIVISWLEHHANIVPWQMLCSETGAKLRVAPVDDDGQIILAEYQKLLNPKTKLVSFTQVSNALGTVTPAQTMIELAQRVGAKVLLDGAQSVSHMPIDVQALNCDWFVFSGHKIFGPTGIGVVYGKAELLETSPPWQGGGNMIEDVTFDHTVYQPAPAKFEAGTGNIADAVGLGAALEYVERLGIANIARYEHELLVYGTEALQRISGVRLIGTAADKASVLSFVLEGHDTQEVGAALNKFGIAVRSGHHCAQPILRRFGLEATVRPSLAFYNTFDEIDRLADAIRHIKSGRDF
ncbi:MAG: family 2A encapsulin nanocompartment cargo protein cysteine desulfurase [Methylococcales bacterium]